MTPSVWPTYESYEDSGVEWLGCVPTSWELIRLGNLFKERRSKVSDQEFQALSVTRNGIVPQLESAAKTNDGDNRKLVRQGDFVINSRSDRKGSSGVSPLDGSVSLINIVLEPTGILPQFCNHLLKSYAFVEEYYRVGRGIVADLWTTRYDEMRGITMALPSMEVQRAIAAFLDEKCAKVDEAVRIKEEQIALLRERRRILIQEAVTRGLNPDVPMKDSGIDWVGQIPAHWNVKRIRNVSKSVWTGRTPPSSAAADYYQGGTIPWYTPSDVRDSGTFDMSAKSINHAAVEHGYVDTYPAKSVYFIGIGGTLGKANLSNSVASCNQQFNVIVPSEAVDSRWILNWMNSYRNVIFAMTDFTTIPIINQAKTKSIVIAVPPRHEQAAILSALSADRNKIDVAISVKEEQITALREYKATLINAAVTGKIKVE